MKTTMQQTHRLTSRSVLALFLIFALSAFRHTDIETQTNPAYDDYTFDAVYVQIPTDNSYFKEYVAERLAKEFKKSKIRMYTAGDLFSPFRDWSAEERRDVLAARGIGATLVISLESADSRVSNGAIFFDAELGMATHVQGRSDRAVFHVRLIDMATTDLAWTAILRTRGNGLLFTGDKSTAKALSKHVAKSLRASGHLLR